jgi:fumarate reductase subunit C
MTMARRTFVRSMDGWWLRNPFFVKYMAREITSVFVALYALILLVGVVRLSQGEAPFEEWVASLGSAPAIALHMGLLGVFLYHTLSWFQVMPKTMAPIVIGGRKVPAWAITAGGMAASLVASVAMLVIFKVLAP